MLDVVSPFVSRSIWLASVVLLACGTLLLAFGIGWAVVEVVVAVRLGAGEQLSDFGRDILTASFLTILAGLLAYAVFRCLGAVENPNVRIDFDRPVVGLHGRRLSVDRLRIEARVSVVARRTYAAVVHDHADEIARTAGEALALMGPRAAHAADRRRAELALTELVNRTLRVSVVREVHLNQIELKPSL